jgi:hypothetical protein
MSRIIFRTLWLAGVFVLLSTIVSPAIVLDQWHWRHPLPQGNPLKNVNYVNGLYVAVGEVGTILTSTNGTNWVRRESGTTATLNDCAYGGGKYIVVGDFGTVLTSPDAQTWDSQYPGTFFSLNAITHGNGQFAAVGDATIILTSPDGISWTARSSGPLDLLDVIYAEGIYVAVGGAFGSAYVPSIGFMVSSADGVIWTRAPLDFQGGLASIAYGEGAFVTVEAEYAERPVMWISDDGQQWERRSTELMGWSRMEVGYGDGAWVLSGRFPSSGFYNEGGIYTSTNLVDWSQVVSNRAGVSGLTYGHAGFIASRDDGSFLVSRGGTVWANPAPELAISGIYDVEYVNDRFIAMGYQSLITSSDGVTWTNQATFTNRFTEQALTAIAYGTNRYVVAGDGRTFVSTDLVTWTNGTGSPRPVAEIVYGKGLFVGLSGSDPNVLSSTDGLIWSMTRLSTNSTEDYVYVTVEDVAFGSGRFVVVGSDLVGSSIDATNWHVVKTNGAALEAVAWGNGRFVAVGYKHVWVTVDGTNWTASPILGLRGTEIAFGGGLFMVPGPTPGYSGYDHPIWISNDGLTWSQRHLYTRRSLYSIGFGNGTFVIGTDSGGILQSDPIVNLNVAMQSQPQLTLWGQRGRSYRIECADALLSEWRPLSTVFLDGASVTVNDLEPRTNSHRLYRAVTVP